MMWILERFLKIVYPKRPKLEYIDSSNRVFDKCKSVFDCEHWTLSDEEYYYYTGKEYKKIEGIVYILDTSLDSEKEPVATPPGIIMYPSNVSIKYPGNIYLKISQKLKIIL
jgi:hypothetical protein